MPRTLLTSLLLATLPWFVQAEEISLTEVVAYTSTGASTLVGEATAGIGDVNGDGYEDLAIAQPDAGEDGEGAVSILYGQANRFPGGVVNDLPTFTGVDNGDHLGAQLGALGDLNADGYDDFALVSNYADTGYRNPGIVYIIYGQASAYSNGTVASRPKIAGEATSAGFGAAIHTAGDLNADGYDDFAIGSTQINNYDGGVYVVYGQADQFSGNIDTADYPFFTGGDFDRAGATLASGDATNDGQVDLVVGVSRHDDNGYDAGRVYIIPGITTRYTDQPLDDFSYIANTTASERIGVSLDIGDVTGDGYNDFVIGAPYNDDEGTNAGKVYVLPGQAVLPATQTLAAATEYTSGTGADLYGNSLAVLSDLSGDGIADWVVGAPSESSSQTGRAFLISATDTTEFTGETIGDQAGSVVTATDLDGDGMDEFIIAAPHYGSDAGKVYVGYWPVYTCDNSVELGGILADYSTDDYKFRKYAVNDHYKIAVQRHGQYAYVLNCQTNEVVQTLQFNERVQRKILARVFSARGEHLFVAVTRTPSKRKIKLFLYKLTEAELVETDYIKRKWRPRGFRIKVNKTNRVELQRGQEKKHKLKYRVETDLTLTAL